MLEFIEAKWGDLVALFIMLLGTGLLLVSPSLRETGSGLIMASLGLLKLTRTYKPNGAPPEPAK